MSTQTSTKELMMATAIYRPDYAKFLFQTHGETWTTYYRTLIAASHEIKFHGDFLKSHKTTRLWFNQDTGLETWSLEIWGEWAGIVERLPSEWIGYLKRFDVRAVLWDATEEAIIEVGQHLQRTITSTNVNCYSTKPRSKRGGRDAGGRGFSIGSHKSDLRITAYKRGGDKCAQEFQCSGSMLDNIVKHTIDHLSGAAFTRSYWHYLAQCVTERGEQRLASVFEKAHMGVYWPTFARDTEYAPPQQPTRYEPTPEDLKEFDSFKQSLLGLEE